MIEKKGEEKPFKENFIGKNAVITTKTKTFQGKIILETKNTLQIKYQNQTKTIIKKNAVIVIDNKTIKGEKITKRTEDRIKMR